MASASSLPCEEQLLCSICLGAFTEPVSTPCGHNYCKTCITGYWSSSDLTQCPLCMKKFRKRPQLQVNTGFRDMVEHFNNMRVKGEDVTQAKPGEVPCDICLEPKLKAQKTCLVCLASYCQAHLEPHQRVSTLKKHQLIEPVSNLEDRVCKKHDKMLELFCHIDQTCVCFMCLKDDHAAHEAVPLEHAFRERKAQVEYVTSEIKMMENSKTSSINELKYSIEQSKKRSEEELVVIAELFTALLLSLQRSQAELVEVIQEKQKAAQKQAEDHVTQMEQEVAELRRRRSEMEQLLQSEDHLRVLQSWPSLYYSAYTEDPLSPFTPDLSGISQQSYVGTVKKAVAQVEKTISNEMEMLIHEVRLSDGCEPVAAAELVTDEFVEEVWNAPQDKLRMIQLSDAVDVTLDAYTANSKLVVSQDGKQLRFCGGPPSLITGWFGRGFEHQPFVLGREGFSSGRFYYEVRVGANKGWLLGVVKESIDKKIFFFPSPEEGGWTLLKSHDSNFQETLYVNPPPIPNTSYALYLSQMPNTVGVFVDYENGEVSFYDVDTRTLIYSYTGCSFIETAPALKDFLYSMVGGSSSYRPKLYPIFGNFGIFYHDSDMLEITPVV